MDINSEGSRVVEFKTGQDQRDVVGSFFCVGVCVVGVIGTACLLDRGISEGCSSLLVGREVCRLELHLLSEGSQGTHQLTLGALFERTAVYSMVPLVTLKFEKNKSENFFLMKKKTKKYFQNC